MSVRFGGNMCVTTLGLGQKVYIWVYIEDTGSDQALTLHSKLKYGPTLFSKKYFTGLIWKKKSQDEAQIPSNTNNFWKNPWNSDFLKPCYYLIAPQVWFEF